MARMSIVFDGFEKLATIAERAGQDIKPAVDEALQETQKYIQQQLEIAAEPYQNKGKKGYAKGNLYDAIIKEPSVEWHGREATVKVGFTSKNMLGFMHSIFVMYGVPAHGKFNKGYQKDAKIYNAIRGTKTKNEIAKIQEQAFKNYFKRKEGLK